MLTGAFAHGLYGIPRSTKDVDVVLSLVGDDPIKRVVNRLSDVVEFEPQIQFDTLTWGRRQVGQSFSNPPFKVELFELFDDPFVQSQFHRNRRLFFGATPARDLTADVVVQKLRWGRNKDLDDAPTLVPVVREMRASLAVCPFKIQDSSSHPTRTF